MYILWLTERPKRQILQLYDVEEIVVKDGLSKDDIVITTWSAQLREGVTVSVKEEEEQ